MRAEEMPHRKSYQERFREATHLLIAAGKTRTNGLRARDVVGAYIAAAVALAQRNMPDLDIANLLRSTADVLDEKAGRESGHDQVIN